MEVERYDRTKFIKVNGKHKCLPLYTVYRDMKQRCYNVNAKSYKNYGGRGIVVCNEWINSYDTFYNDMIEYYKKGLELDRRDNDLGYSKDNCRWATKSVNGSNRRIVDSKYLSGAKKIGNKFSSSIKINQVFYHIGMYDSEIEAHEEYRKIKKEWFGQ